MIDLEPDEAVEWIPGYEGEYAVTTNGRVWSRRSAKFMKGGATSNGYYRVSLRTSEGRTTEYIHRAVLLAFRGPPPAGKTQAAHGNGDKGDNKLSNLRWASAAENARDRDGHGTTAKAESHGWARMDSATVVEIRERHATGELSYTDIANQYGINRSHAQRLISGKNWSEAGGPTLKGDGTKRGESLPQSVLVEDQVIEIRRRYAEGGVFMRELAADYGVSESTVRRVIKRLSWAHI